MSFKVWSPNHPSLKKSFSAEASAMKAAKHLSLVHRNVRWFVDDRNGKMLASFMSGRNKTAMAREHTHARYNLRGTAFKKIRKKSSRTRRDAVRLPRSIDKVLIRAKGGLFVRFKKASNGERNHYGIVEVFPSGRTVIRHDGSWKHMRQLWYMEGWQKTSKRKSRRDVGWW